MASSAPDPSFFAATYKKDAPAPWDIRRPQGALRQPRVQAVLKGRILDVGSGLGDNAIYEGSLDGVQRVVGVDFAVDAVAEAKRRLAAGGSEDARARVSFVHGDVFDLDASVGPLGSDVARSTCCWTVPCSIASETMPSSATTSRL